MLMGQVAITITAGTTPSIKVVIDSRTSGLLATSLGPQMRLMTLVRGVGTRRQISKTMFTTGFASLITIAPTYPEQTPRAIACISNSTQRAGFSHRNATSTARVCDRRDEQAKAESSFKSRLHDGTHFFLE